MTGNVIDLQRYRAERRAPAPASAQFPAGMVVMMVPAIYCVPVMMMPAAFMPQAMTAPAS